MKSSVSLQGGAIGCKGVGVVSKRRYATDTGEVNVRRLLDGNDQHRANESGSRTRER